MTRLEKSPEQLDAEAADTLRSELNPVRGRGSLGVPADSRPAPDPIEERDLDAAIALHRALYAVDISWVMKLHQRDGDYGIGVPFNPVFEAYLDGRLGAFPWSKALQSLRQNCRVNHAPKHTDREEWRGSLCHSLLVIVIRHEHPVAEAQRQLGLPNAGKTKRTLDNALLFLERRLEDAYWRDQQTQPVQRTPAEWMRVEHRQRHDQPGMHRVDCQQCLRAAVA